MRVEDDALPSDEYARIKALFREMLMPPYREVMAEQRELMEGKIKDVNGTVQSLDAAIRDLKYDLVEKIDGLQFVDAVEELRTRQEGIQQLCEDIRLSTQKCQKSLQMMWLAFAVLVVLSATLLAVALI